MLMLFGRRQARANRRTIEALHAGIVTAARHPLFYTDYGVADTFEGRFEMLTLLAGLVLRHLNGAQAPGPEVAQRLVDTLFRHLDPALRELGVGDLGVPKKMKRLAGAFMGRSVAYDAALRGDADALAEALSRNIYEGASDAGRLARYVQAADSGMDATALDEFLGGALRFPDPATIH